MELNKITDKLSKSVNLYLQILPIEKQLEINQKLHQEQLEDYNDYLSYLNLEYPEIKLKDLKKIFIEIATLRNELAAAQEFENFTDMSVKKYGMHGSQISEFLENSPSVAKNINKLLDLGKIELFENTCLTCQMQEFPFKKQKDVVSFFANNYDFLNKDLNRVKIKKGEYSQMIYDKDDSQIAITINKNINNRHKLKDLFHEMCHVVNLLESLNADKSILNESKYLREKKAIEIESKISKKVSTDFHNAFLFDSLLNMKEVFFEIKLYDNPNQDIDKLYADAHNKIFYKSDQKKNPVYLFNKDILFRPQYSLPHSFLFYELLSG